jgi:hypothetical protein
MVLKKYKLTNVWAVIILFSISMDANYLTLPFPFQQGPLIVLGILFFFAVSSYIASYFL